MRTLFLIRPTTPNIGNEVIALGQEILLRSALGGGLNLVTLSASASEGVKGGGLTARTVYEINQLADGLVIGSGNLFENGALHVDPAALAALNVPVLLMGVSTGRVFDRSGRLVPRTDSLAPERVLALCRLATAVLARDEASRDHLASLGARDAAVGGCPTFHLGDAGLALPPADPAVAGGVLISVRNPRLMSVPYSLQGRVHRDVRALVDHFREQGKEVRLLCHDFQDLPFARSFPDVPALYTEAPARFLAWLRDAALNVGYRLHAFLPSVALGTPAVHLCYDERARSLIRTAGLGDWDVDYVHCGDALGAVRRRCDELSRLAELAARSGPLRHRCKEVTLAALRHFAGRIDEARQERRF